MDFQPLKGTVLPCLSPSSRACTAAPREPDEPTTHAETVLWRINFTLNWFPDLIPHVIAEMLLCSRKGGVRLFGTARLRMVGTHTSELLGLQIGKRRQGGADRRTRSTGWFSKKLNSLWISHWFLRPILLWNFRQVTYLMCQFLSCEMRTTLSYITKVL